MSHIRSGCKIYCNEALDSSRPKWTLYFWTEMPDQEIPEIETTEELRLFPLNTVLFPGVKLPLRIFEERYKRMINECLDTDSPFGVLMIREGMEIGGPAVPYSVGTTARITEVEKLEEGRMNISTIGEQRFRIVETVQEKPFLKSRVVYVPEEMGEVGEDVLNRASELFQECLQGLSGLQGGWTRKTPIDQTPGQLSYSIAHYLELPSKAKQRLLDLLSTGERLYYEIPLLEGANKRIREELIKRAPYKGAKLN